MNTFWNFPAAAGINIISYNNAGIETFRGNPLTSAGREIPQNSIEAVNDNSKPVIVEFSRFDLPTKQFPKRSELMDVLKKCEQTWENKNPKGEVFIKNAQKILAEETISILRVSDFNTKGLQGAKSGELGTLWSSLIRESGSSNKGNSSGGSFGIGINAPTANSKIRTLFYDSLDIDGVASHVGVANIMSFKEGENTSTGMGYYTNSKYFTSIDDLLSLDPNFKRTEPGTDIYISAFQPSSDWKTQLLHSILLNFFMTIHFKKLVVRIENIEINAKNLPDYIDALDDTEEFRVLKNYYRVLINEETIKIPSPTFSYPTVGKFEEGEATLYIMNGDELNRRILMTRKSGMRLFERGHISGSISFTGILMIHGKNMNAFFKDLENPAHTAWEKDRYETNPAEAEKVLKDLYKFMRSEVLKHFQTATSDVVDAFGLSDFLPDIAPTTDGQQAQESLTIKIKEVKLAPKKTKTKPKKPKEITAILKDSGIDEVDDEDQTTTPTPGPTPGPDPDPKPEPGPKPLPEPTPKPGEIDEASEKKSFLVLASFHFVRKLKCQELYHKWLLQL